MAKVTVHLSDADRSVSQTWDDDGELTAGETWACALDIALMMLGAGSPPIDTLRLIAETYELHSDEAARHPDCMVAAAEVDIRNAAARLRKAHDAYSKREDNATP